MFNSPLEWCPAQRLWIALDEGRAACVQRNLCRVEICPLAARLIEPSAPPLGTPSSTGSKRPE